MLVRHKPTGSLGLVVPEICGYRCCSWSRVNVILAKDDHLLVRMILVEELEIVERVDPETLDPNLFLTAGEAEEI